MTSFMAKLAELAAPDAWLQKDEIELANEEIHKSAALINSLERQLAEKNVAIDDTTMGLEDEREGQQW